MRNLVMGDCCLTVRDITGGVRIFYITIMAAHDENDAHKENYSEIMVPMSLLKVIAKSGKFRQRSFDWDTITYRWNNNVMFSANENNDMITAHPKRVKRPFTIRDWTFQRKRLIDGSNKSTNESNNETSHTSDCGNTNEGNNDISIVDNDNLLNELAEESAHVIAHENNEFEPDEGKSAIQLSAISDDHSEHDRYPVDNNQINEDQSDQQSIGAHEDLSDVEVKTELEHNDSEPDDNVDSDDEMKEDGYLSPTMTDEKEHMIDCMFENVQEMLMNDRKILKPLNISINWELPFLHTLEKNFSKSSDVTEICEKYGDMINKGFFTDKEDAMIERNWEKFCKKYNIPKEHRHLFINLPNIPLNDRLNFIRFLARGLDDRLLRSVYQHFVRLHSDFSKTKFSRKDDEIILLFTKKYGRLKNRFLCLGHLLNRSHEAVLLRYKKLRRLKQTGIPKDRKRFFWDTPACIKAIKLLVAVTNVNSYMQLKDREISSFEFAEVARQMDGYLDGPAVAAKWKNNIHPRLFTHEDINISALREQMVEWLYSTEQDEYRLIDWSPMLQAIPGSTTTFLITELQKLFKQIKIPEELKKNFKAAIAYLKTTDSLKKRRNQWMTRIIMPP